MCIAGRSKHPFEGDFTRMYSMWNSQDITAQSYRIVFSGRYWRSLWSPHKQTRRIASAIDNRQMEVLCGSDLSSVRNCYFKVKGPGSIERLCQPADAYGAHVRSSKAGRNDSIADRRLYGSPDL